MYGLVGQNFDVKGDIAFVELAPLHVKVSYLNLHAADFRVECVGDEEAFDVARDGLVEAIKADGGTDLFRECDGVGGEGDDGIGGF